MIRFATPFIVLLLLGTFLVLSGCSTEDIEIERKYPQGLDGEANEGDIYSGPDSIFGDGGLKILGGREEKDDGTGANGIDVNSFLWRASIDTVSFMPLTSADPFGGVILTDWYQPDVDMPERFKLNVFIYGRQLRSDGIKVKVFKQSLKGGAWVDVETPQNMGTQLEDTILTRARQLRVAQFGDE